MEIIKSDFMLKRSQMKGQLFYHENYAQRWFELTPTLLRYKDGTNETGANKIKGTVMLNSILSVEIADPAIIGDRPNGFQITYKVFESVVGELRTLYVIAPFSEQRDDWIAALRKAATDAGGLLGQKYHPGMWVGKSYSCCGHINRRDEGCIGVTCSKMADKSSASELSPKMHKENDHANLNQKFSKLLVQPRSQTEEKNNTTPQPKPRLKPALNPPIAQPTKKTVIALYDFLSMDKDHIDLIQGEEYTLIEEVSSNGPAKVKNAEGKIGYVPENYIQVITGKENDLNLFEWFYPNTSKSQAEIILSEDGREGCFLVRKSAKDDYNYALSVLTRKAKNIDTLEEPFSTKHYHIKMQADNKYYLSDKHLFDSVPQLIFYHKRNCAGLTVRLKCHPSDKEKPPPLLDLMEISIDDLAFKQDLGVGQFGKVQMAIWNKKYQVAVKTVKPGMMSEIDFLDEAHNMAKLRHPNLVKLIGVSRSPLMIVVEYMKHGALTQYLKRNEQLFSKEQEKLLDICVQISDGMKYLEEKKVIHRDLAARNCLVGDGQVIKVCDFGLARYVPDDEYLSSFGTKFPFRWASPEVMIYNTFSSKSDVWAFGILMWEVYTCGKQLPYYQLKSNPEVGDFVCANKGRCEQPAFCSTSVYKVMMTCWEQDPDNRPSFLKLSMNLRNLLEEK